MGYFVGRAARLAGLSVCAAVLAIYAVASTAKAQCGPNPIVCENALPGSPASEWDVAGAGDPSIQGFATDISVNKGQTVSFKVSTDASSFNIDVYRLGYYSGLG